MEIPGEMARAIAIAVTILSAAVITAYSLSRDKSKNTKQIVWGITVMLAIAPLFTWIVSILYGVYEGSGFAGAALMMVMFPPLFLIGLILLLLGILKKRKTTDFQ